MADIEEVVMTAEELYKQYYDAELSQLICQHMGGKSCMIAYVTLCTILGNSIGSTSQDVPEMQHAMEMCGQLVANAAQAAYEGEKDAEADPVSKLQ